MELTYPINLTGFENDANNGDVLTQYGEFLGCWEFVEDQVKGNGVFHFTPDGKDTPMISEVVAILDSRICMGTAMSALCRGIREWHDVMSEN